MTDTRSQPTTAELLDDELIVRQFTFDGRDSNRARKALTRIWNSHTALKSRIELLEVSEANELLALRAKVDELTGQLREALDHMHKARLDSIHHATDKVSLGRKVDELTVALAEIIDIDRLQVRFDGVLIRHDDGICARRARKALAVHSVDVAQLQSAPVREALDWLINCVECEVNVPGTTTVFQLRLAKAKEALAAAAQQQPEPAGPLKAWRCHYCGSTINPKHSDGEAGR